MSCPAFASSKDDTITDKFPAKKNKNRNAIKKLKKLRRTAE